MKQTEQAQRGLFINFQISHNVIYMDVLTFFINSKEFVVQVGVARATLPYAGYATAFILPLLAVDKLSEKGTCT